MNKIFEALRKEGNTVTEANGTGKYTVIGHYADYQEEVKTFNNFRAAMTYVFESSFAAQMSSEDCHALSINNGEGSIFEINYYGNTEVNVGKCATEDELRVISDFLNEGNTVTVSVAFDVEVNADLSEENIEQLIRNSLKNAGMEVSSYMEVHTQG